MPPFIRYLQSIPQIHLLGFIATNEHCVQNIMEATLRRGLEPVNEAEDSRNQCLSVSEFWWRPEASLQVHSLGT